MTAVQHQIILPSVQNFAMQLEINAPLVQVVYEAFQRGITMELGFNIFDRSDINDQDKANPVILHRSLSKVPIIKNGQEVSSVFFSFIRGCKYFSMNVKDLNYFFANRSYRYLGPSVQCCLKYETDVSKIEIKGDSVDTVLQAAVNVFQLISKLFSNTGKKHLLTYLSSIKNLIQISRNARSSAITQNTPLGTPLNELIIGYVMDEGIYQECIRLYLQLEEEAK